MSVFARIGADRLDSEGLKVGGKANDLLRKATGRYSGAAKMALAGNVSGAVAMAMGKALGATVPSAATAWLTMGELRRLFEQAMGRELAKKNLWCVSVQPFSELSILPNFNLYALALNYNGVSLSPESVNVGSGFFHPPSAADPVRIQMTVYDEREGFIKRWAEEVKGLEAHPDGTFGLPIEYAMQIAITHASAQIGEDGMVERFFNVKLESCEVDLDRSAEEFEVLQLSFIQDDSFGSL